MEKWRESSKAHGEIHKSCSMALSVRNKSCQRRRRGSMASLS
jgi:hypothetical protein